MILTVVYFYLISLFTSNDIDRVILLPNSKCFAYPCLQRSLILNSDINTIYAIYRNIINLRISILRINVDYLCIYNQCCT